MNYIEKIKLLSVVISIIMLFYMMSIKKSAGDGTFTRPDGSGPAPAPDELKLVSEAVTSNVSHQIEMFSEMDDPLTSITSDFAIGYVTGQVASEIKNNSIDNAHMAHHLENTFIAVFKDFEQERCIVRLFDILGKPNDERSSEFLLGLDEAWKDASKCADGECRPMAWFDYAKNKKTDSLANQPI